MSAIKILRVFFFILISAKSFYAQSYVPPDAFVEPLKPIGIRISVPHENGISLVAYHVKFNEDFNGLEAGTIARDIGQHKNGRWTYEDRSTKLKNGDVIYYWVHIIYNGLGYNLLGQEHVVNEFYDYKGNKIQSGGNSGSTNNNGNFGNNNGNNEDNGNYGNNGNTGSNERPCVSSNTKLYDQTGASRYPCAGQLLFEDNFRDLAQFKRMQWTVVEQFSGSPDYEFVVYRNSRENVQVDNGLKLSPKSLKNEYGDTFIREGKLKLEKCTGRTRTLDCFREARGWNILPFISSGRVNTKKSINFEYGRVEIKAKFPQGDWIYPLLVLEPVRNFEGSTLETVQIRVASAAGNSQLRLKDGTNISGHVLWGGATGLNPNQSEDHINRNRATNYNRDLWSNAYHTYECIWSPNRIVLKVDGETYDDKRVNLPRDTPFYLTLGLAAGGLSEFPDYSVSGDYTKTWRNVEAKALYHFYNSSDTWSRNWRSRSTSLEVEHVKIWAL